MKKVFDIETLSMIEVPEDYIRCSICKKWKAPVEYSRNKRGLFQSWIQRLRRKYGGLFQSWTQKLRRNYEKSI